MYSSLRLSRACLGKRSYRFAYQEIAAGWPKNGGTHRCEEPSRAVENGGHLLEEPLVNDVVSKRVVGRGVPACRGVEGGRRQEEDCCGGDGGGGGGGGGNDSVSDSHIPSQAQQARGQLLEWYDSKQAMKSRWK